MRLPKRGGGEPLGVEQMLWTEEAVEVLKELALEGRSASVIAAALGGASRSAVIGKANRIGIKLNGGRGGCSARRTRAVMRQVQLAAMAPQPAPAEQSSAPPFRCAGGRKAAWSFAEAEVGEMRRVGFEEIHQFVCRWPLGDPMSGDFAYCGLKAANGRSYCAGHCRMAYQPPKPRPRRDWREQRRSFALADPPRLSWSASARAPLSLGGLGDSSAHRDRTPPTVSTKLQGALGIGLIFPGGSQSLLRGSLGRMARTRRTS